MSDGNYHHQLINCAPDPFQNSSTTRCVTVISLMSLLEKLGIQMSGRPGSLDWDQTHTDGSRDRALETVSTHTHWAFGKGTEKHTNAGD